MRVVFMGTPQIAADCLSCLIADGFDLVGVYTKPDMPKNRGMKLAMSEVKEVALAAGLPVYQPATFPRRCRRGGASRPAPDVITSWPMAKILPRACWTSRSLAASTSTRSILPALRLGPRRIGPFLNGLDETGVTAMYPLGLNG